MLNRITMLYWTRRPVFVLLLAALLLLGGCTGEDMKTIGTGTAAGVLASMTMCLLFRACHF
jgi:hypothetical protein